VAAATGVTVRTVARVIRAGRVADGDAWAMHDVWKDRSPTRLSLADRVAISVGVRTGRSLRAIAAELHRSASTVSREVAANGGRDGYCPLRADRRASQRARRPKQSKLASCARLAMFVSAGLEQRWSPAQIAARLIAEHPDDDEMRVSPETIYQTLFVQGRGGLRRELVHSLRSGRIRRRPHRRCSLAVTAATAERGPVANKVMISERPAEAADRAVPGHWEGDLLMGAHNRSAIATLVERTTRFVMLVEMPSRQRSAEAVAARLSDHIITLPAQLRRSLTWDQGSEMAAHRTFSVITGVPVYFCDPHSPWQRGSNENTNGLLRQYFPKSTSLSGYRQADLDAVAAELNGRPRQTLGWMTPSERFSQLVATTT
jgi:transposase, IS30 family